MNRHFIAALRIGVAAAFLSACGGQATPSTVQQGATVQMIGESSSSFRVLLRYGRTHTPSAPLLNLNGALYGTTSELTQCSHHRCHGFGTVFRISSGGAKKVIYSFKGGVSDGAGPAGPLLAVNGTLYGTTARGGGTGCESEGCGTVYSLSTGGSEKMLYAFKGGSDGANPFTGLSNVNGTLYGTTPQGGSNINCVGQDTGCGTVYSVSTSGSETVLYRFVTMSDGWVPDSALIDVNGMLYGTTESGGVKCGTKTEYYDLGCGTVYSITASGTETVLHTFDDSTLTAVIPIGGLVNVHDTLYGLTMSSKGAVYKVGLTGDRYKVVHYFQGAPDGLGPVGVLIDVGGLLYGATTGGGSHNLGSIFTLRPNGKETVLYSFGGEPNGEYPNGGLTAVQNSFYGTTSAGGRPHCFDGCGTAFAYTP